MAATATAPLVSTPPVTAPPVSTPLAMLMAGVAAVRTQDPTELSGPAALAEAALLLRELSRLGAVSLRRLADVDTRELYVFDGAPSVGTWVEQQQVGAGRAQVALARRLARLPAVADAVEAGTLSLPSAERVGEALDAARPHLDRPDGLLDGMPAEEVLTAVIVDGVAMSVAQARGGAPTDDPDNSRLRADLLEIAGAPLPAGRRVEAAFVRLATEVEPAQVRAALRLLVDALLPQQLEDRAEQAHRDRGFDLSRNTDGSGWTVRRGQLDLECGELLFTVLEAQMATDPDNPTDTEAFADLRQDLLPSQLPRSRRQRLHDALALTLRRTLDTGALGVRDKIAPHLAVTVSLASLEGRPGAMPGVAASGMTLPRSLVARWLCDSSVTRFVLDLAARVVEVSHTERTLKAHERRALAVRWGGGCAGAGCTRGPGHRMIPHHVTPFARCGTTSLADTVPLCESTHHDLHEGGRIVRLKDGRYIGPTGRVDGPMGWVDGPAG